MQVQKSFMLSRSEDGSSADIFFPLRKVVSAADVLDVVLGIPFQSTPYLILKFAPQL